MSGVECDMDMEIEIAFEGGLYHGAHTGIILFMDPTIWKYFILKKDLNPESLRWYLLLQQIDFEVRQRMMDAWSS